MADEEEEEAVEGTEEEEEARPSKTTQDTRPSSTVPFEPKKQNLFLIEFLIDTVNLNADVIDEEILEYQTCCKLKFLHFPTMDVCEKDFYPEKEVGSNSIRFNSGKSLMFALPEQHFANPPPICLQLTVFKCVPKESKEGKEEEPEHIPVGHVKICLSMLFRQIFEEVQRRPDCLPCSKSMKDKYLLSGRGKRSGGEVGIYIRISCLGQNVVTEFQCGTDISTEPVLFKSKEGKNVFECKPLEPPSDEAICQGGKGEYGRPAVPASTAAGTVQGTADDVIQANKIIFQMPSQADRCQGDHNVVEYKVSNQKDVYQVIPGSLADPSRTKDGLTLAQLDTDPSKNVFVLRVGDKEKKSDKPKMILELRTPKQKILPVILPPYHEDIAIQTESDKKKKKKGKKKKK